MAYFEPFIDETGMHIPSYSDLRDQLIAEMKQIFGDDIYLDPDSADYQLISILSKKIFDTYSFGVLVYNNRTPITAIGVGLDNAVAYANITRKRATYSTVQLTITGSAGTILSGCQAQDVNGYNWDIPETTIPENGSITVNATCSVSGNIGALPNTITRIVTPLFGWTGVTNNYAAQPGTNVETDAELRGRYAYAIQSPSMTVFDSMIASVEELDAVTRVTAYENDTSAQSTGTEPPNLPAGLPPHSVTFVVEGGDDDDIAMAIYMKKTPGCYTNGTTQVTVTSEQGNIDIIRFYRPTYTPIYIQLNVTKLQSWNDEYEDKMKDQIVNYINGLEIADNVYRSFVWSQAIAAMDDISNPSYTVTNVTMGTASGSLSGNDIEIDFNAAAQITANNITVVYS